MKKTFIFIVLTGLFLSLASCDYDEQCRKDRYVRMDAAFYKTTFNPTSNTTTISAVSLKNLSVQGIGSDSLLYKNDSVSSVILPLKKFETQTRFRISWGGVSDTITLFHTNTDTFISLECGVIKTYTIDSVRTTTHFIDSVKIAEKNINTTTSAKENIKIYN